MDIDFIERLEAHRLSPARRLFVLQQMISRLPASTSKSLRERIEELIELEQALLRCQTDRRRRDDCGRQLQTIAGEGTRRRSLRRRAHREFVVLVAQLLRCYPPSISGPLLEVVHRQLERVRRFEHRPDTSPRRHTRSHRFQRQLT